jgi:predicted transposase/invertase (TIGR01784 family)
MAKYLDPKADLTFKKIFGEHKNLVISLLNALLPFNKKQKITEIEYLPSELTPDNPMRKNSIVDVRCKSIDGRQFIVEMQMEWTTAFKQRVLFNASKAYVRQLKKSKKYHLLQPVYSLSLVNDVFENDIEDFYHYYRLVHEEHTEKVIDGLHLVFVELPKFKPHTISEKKMQVLWLRFLTEIGEDTKEVPKELIENAEVKQAIEIVEESAYTDNELAQYDKFWDAIRIEQAFVDEAEIRYGLGIKKAKTEDARKMKAKGYAIEDITEITGLTAEEIEGL